jgi:hypothetical protein
MADLSWGDVMLVGGVATVGFTLLSFWYSAVMSKRGWTYQFRNKPKKREPEDKSG